MKLHGRPVCCSNIPCFIKKTDVKGLKDCFDFSSEFLEHKVNLPIILLLTVYPKKKKKKE